MAKKDEDKEKKGDKDSVIVPVGLKDDSVDSSVSSEDNGSSGGMVSSSSAAGAATGLSPFMVLVLIIIMVVIGAAVYLFVFKGGNGGGSNLPSKLSTSVEGFDVSTDIAYSQTELWELDSTLDELWMYGYYQDDGYGANLMENMDDYGGTLLDLTDANGVESIINDDLVLVGGRYSEDGYTFTVSSIGSITEEDINVFNLYKYPYAKIEILDAPETITHGCENREMTVRIANIGKIPIRKSDFYTFSTELSKYKFIQITDGSEDAAYSFNEDTNDIVNHGYLGFTDLQPGESKEFTYGLGGYVEKSDIGTGGGPNSLCSPDFSFPGGNREVKLAIGYLKPGSYTENILTSVSDPVTINVLDCECDLTAEN